MNDKADDDRERWDARPVGAELVRAGVFLVPISASAAFVYVASGLWHPPTSSLALYVGWWLTLSAAATVVLVAMGRVSRRLLPLAALLRLSLVVPDGARSRFRTALASGTVRNLEQRLADARGHGSDVSTGEAASRLLALVAALDTHDSITRGHSERVRALSQMIGRELGLKQDDIDRLNWAALLHDIGKLDVPQAILNKKGRPTDDEWAAIRRHPELGEALVAPLRDWLGEWCDAVGSHHERWDGGGYPRGVARAEIPLAGRIVAVADAFDVITSARSYKKAASATAARKELIDCAGSHFDPEVVRALVAVSLGRARLATGPLAWLADAVVLARVPLLTVAGTASTAAIIATSPSLVGHKPVQASAPVTAASAATNPVQPVRTDPAPRGAKLATATTGATKRASAAARSAVEAHAQDASAGSDDPAPEARAQDASAGSEAAPNDGGAGTGTDAESTSVEPPSGGPAPSSPSLQHPSVGSAPAARPPAAPAAPVPSLSDATENVTDTANVAIDGANDAIDGANSVVDGLNGAVGDVVDSTGLGAAVTLPAVPTLPPLPHIPPLVPPSATGVGSLLGGK